MKARISSFSSVLICFMLIVSFFVLPPVFGSAPEDAGFSYYVPVTINSTLVDEALTDFPLLFHLNGSCGTNSFDASPVFDEIGDQYNWSGYSDADGNMFFWEPEYWNSTEREAYVWVRIPFISSSSDTIFYFWFEKFIDGSAYNSPEDVWDFNFVGVWHMNDNPDTSHVKDSTSNDNDGTKKAANEPIEATGQIGKAQDFDGNDDLVTVSSDAALNPTSLTFSFWVKVQSLPTDGLSRGATIMFKGTQYLFFIRNSGGTMTVVVDGGGFDAGPWDSGVTVLLNTLTHLMITINSDFVKVYKEGALGNSVEGFSLISSGDDLFFAKVSGLSGSEYLDAIIDESSVSSAVRSAAWVGASYETQNFNLHSFGSISIFEMNLAARGEIVGAAVVASLIFIPLLMIIIFAARRRR